MSDEQNTGTPAEGVSAPAKKKKVNKLTAKEIDSKIQEMTDKNLTNAVYFKHLVERKSRMTAK